MPTKTESIKTFLTAASRPDLAALYNAGMECQVNVAQDGGERVDGEYKGRRWVGWTDGATMWKPFRIPWNAMSKPEFNDSEIKWDLAQHAEGIGMTGWDWKNRLRRLRARLGLPVRKLREHIPAQRIQAEAEAAGWKLVRARQVFPILSENVLLILAAK